MTTIADNIRAMAQLVASVKKESHLTETTILRIVDMSFALAEQRGQTLNDNTDEPQPEIDPADYVDTPLDLPIQMFPATDEDIEAVEDLPEPKDEEDDSLATTKTLEN